MGSFCFFVKLFALTVRVSFVARVGKRLERYGKRRLGSQRNRRRRGGSREIVKRFLRFLLASERESEDEKKNLKFVFVLRWSCERVSRAALLRRAASLLVLFSPLQCVVRLSSFHLFLIVSPFEETPEKKDNFERRSGKRKVGKCSNITILDDE